VNPGQEPHHRAAAGPAPADGAAVGLRSRRVLVLSSDSVIRDLVEVILKSHGLIVEQAETLLDVRSLVATRPVFACLADCRRSAARGGKLLRQVAELGLVHAVALVDRTDGDGEAAARSAGVSAVVRCPFENRALVEVLAGLPPQPARCPGASLGGQ
jgi:DNA-binding NtrC family response regulator